MALVASPACSGESTRAQAPASVDQSAISAAVVDPPVPQGAATAVLVDPGAEPRARLRLEPHVGETQSVSATVAVSVDAIIDGAGSPMSIPTINEGLTVTTNAVGADGMITAAIVIADASYNDPANVPDAAKRSLASTVGLTFDTVMTPYGEVASTTYDPSGLAPDVRATFDQLEGSLKQFSLPYPRDPVGVGAVWTVDSATSPMGISTTTRSRVSLTAHDGSSVHKKTDVTSRVQSGPTKVNGVDTTIDAGSGSGSGWDASDLSTLLPTASHQEATTNVKMRITPTGGPTQSVNETITTTTDLQSSTGTDTSGPTTSTPEAATTTVPGATTSTAPQTLDDAMAAAGLPQTEINCVAGLETSDPAFGQAVGTSGQLSPTEAHTVTAGFLKCMPKLDIAVLLFSGSSGSISTDQHGCLLAVMSTMSDSDLEKFIAEDPTTTNGLWASCPAGAH